MLVGVMLSTIFNIFLTLCKSAAYLLVLIILK